RARAVARTHPSRDEAVVWRVVEGRLSRLARPRRAAEASGRRTGPDRDAPNLDTRPALPSPRPCAGARRRTCPQPAALGACSGRRVLAAASQTGGAVQRPAQDLVETARAGTLPTSSRQGVVDEMGDGYPTRGQRRSGVKISGRLSMSSAPA